jgi:HEPN domain-containing protein
MLPEPGSPADWLRHAKSDLALARQAPSGDVLAETLCFHAQQAVEKSIKAVLISVGIAFPEAHSIERLVGMLPTAVSRGPDLLAAEWLTVYATILRYPGAQETVSEERLREAQRLAEAVLRWAEGTVHGGERG